MKTTVTRRLEWDAAHRVMRHGSKCATLHGHRYVAEITVSAPRLDDLDMVVDFGIVKGIVGSWIDETWDHTTILNAQDERLLDFLRAERARNPRLKVPYVLQGEPTAELISEHLLGVASNLLTSERGLRVDRVRVYETPSCWADAEAG